jgi:uncharacterized protein YndB with AHSA1/START domain
MAPVSNPAIDDPNALGPIVKQVEVHCPPERAFEVFTNLVHEWWPLATHSVFGDDAAGLSFGTAVGDQIVETSRTGESCSWGAITAYEPGRRLAFTWHPGISAEQTTQVEVRFAPTERGTLVELVHEGWAKRDDPIARRAGYDVGWVVVLDRYASRSAA